MILTLVSGGGGGLHAFKPVTLVLGGTRPGMQGDVGNKKDARKDRKIKYISLVVRHRF